MNNRLERGTGSFRNIGAREQALDLWVDKKEAEREAWDASQVIFWVQDPAEIAEIEKLGVKFNPDGSMLMSSRTLDKYALTMGKKETNGQFILRLFREGKVKLHRRP